MTICSAVFSIMDGGTMYKIKFLCTAIVKGSSSSHPINRHYTVTVTDACMETTYRTTENPTIVKAQQFLTKHLKQIQCIS